MSKSRKEADEKTSAGADEDEQPLSDGWLSWLLLAFFLLICLVTWYLVHRGMLRGAPDAPVGLVCGSQPTEETRKWGIREVLDLSRCSRDTHCEFRNACI